MFGLRGPEKKPGWARRRKLPLIYARKEGSEQSRKAACAAQFTLKTDVVSPARPLDRAENESRRTNIPHACGLQRLNVLPFKHEANFNL